MTTGRLVPLVDPVAKPVTANIVPNGMVWTLDGRVHRRRSVSGFRIGRRIADRENVRPLLDWYRLRDFNEVREWPYVMWGGGRGWESPTADEQYRALMLLAGEGFYVEKTLLTDDDPARIQPAQELVSYLTQHRVPNLLLEIGNEPRANGKRIDCAALVSVCQNSGYPWASGLNDPTSEAIVGTFITHHPRRTSEWIRYGHDGREFWSGEGPSEPHPPWHIPSQQDEPDKPSGVGYAVADFYQHALTCGQMMGGVTFHYENGKDAMVPTTREVEGVTINGPLEDACAEAHTEGVHALPYDLPTKIETYRRIDEQGQTLRTYVVGDWLTRLRPMNPNVCPEPGWTQVDSYLWRR